MTQKFEDIGPANKVVTGTGISLNGRYLAVLANKPADKVKDQQDSNSTEAFNTVSVYDTVTLQLEWTCDVHRCDYLKINDDGNVLFIIAHRINLVAYECQVKDGVKVVVKHTLPSLSTTLDAMCFLHGNHLIVGTTFGQLVKLDLKDLQGIILYQPGQTQFNISLKVSMRFISYSCLGNNIHCR